MNNQPIEEIQFNRLWENWQKKSKPVLLPFTHKLIKSFLAQFPTCFIPKKYWDNQGNEIENIQQDNLSLIVENAYGLIIHLQVEINETGTKNILKIFVPTKSYEYYFHNLSKANIEYLNNRDNKGEIKQK